MINNKELPLTSSFPNTANWPTRQALQLIASASFGYFFVIIICEKNRNNNDQLDVSIIVTMSGEKKGEQILYNIDENGVTVVEK